MSAYADAHGPENPFFVGPARQESDLPEIPEDIDNNRLSAVLFASSQTTVGGLDRKGFNTHTVDNVLPWLLGASYSACKSHRVAECKARAIAGKKAPFVQHVPFLSLVLGVLRRLGSAAHPHPVGSLADIPRFEDSLQSTPRNRLAGVIRREPSMASVVFALSKLVVAKRQSQQRPEYSAAPGEAEVTCAVCLDDVPVGNTRHCGQTDHAVCHECFDQRLTTLGDDAVLEPLACGCPTAAGALCTKTFAEPMPKDPYLKRPVVRLPGQQSS